MNYADLQVTTHFSFLRGVSSAEELFSTAAMLGIKALGIVDRNSLAGMVRPANRSGGSKQKSFGLRAHSGPLTLTGRRRRASASSMQCCGFDLQVVQEIGRALHRNALMIEPQPIEAAQLGAIAGAARPAVMTLWHDDAVPGVGIGD